MTDLAAALLTDLPRYACTNAGDMEDDPFGKFLFRTDVLAALSRALDPAIAERAGALTRRLRKTEEAGHIHHLSKADRLAAADLITALLAQNAALRANTVQALDEADREYSRKTNDLIERHAEQLAALRAEAREMGAGMVTLSHEHSMERARAEAAEAQIAALTARVEKLTGAGKALIGVLDAEDEEGDFLIEAHGSKSILMRYAAAKKAMRAALSTTEEHK